MSLHVETLCLDDFRGYSHIAFENLSRLTVIAGPNAVGKTNVVEALQLLCSGTSFRKPSWSETISWGREVARLQARFEGDGRLVEHRLIIRGNERTYEVNGKKKSAAAIRGTCPCVLFIPDDLQMVKASSGMRRGAIDDIGVQLSKNYAQLKSEYQKVLRQRNLLIRDGVADPLLLESWNESLALNGARLCSNRWRLFSRLAEYMGDIYVELVDDEEVCLRYLPSWARFDDEGRQLGDVIDVSQFDLDEAYDVERAQAEIGECLRRYSDVECRRKTTLFGPHKDEIVFFINGKNARLFASQGQQRTLVLAWKLAELRLVNEIVGQNPVLLLDDVMSELDAAHRGALSKFVEQAAQTFITTANLGYFSDELLSKARVIDMPIPGARHVY